MIAPAFIAILFSGFLFFDAMAILARVSASSIERNAFGATMEKMMSTLKRLMIFSYPPILGYLIVTGDTSSIFRAIFSSYALGSAVIILVYLNRRRFYRYFAAVTFHFDHGGSALSSMKSAFSNRRSIEGCDESVFGSAKVATAFMNNHKLLMFSSWIFFVHGSAIFLINLIALKFSDYAPIILQSLGVINGLGTLVMAFLVDPVVSRFLDRRIELDQVAQVIVGAQFLASSVLGPTLFGLLYFVV